MIKLLGIPFDGNSSFLKGPALAPPRIRQMDTDGSLINLVKAEKRLLQAKHLPM